MNVVLPLVAAMDLLKLHLIAMFVFVSLDLPLPWVPASLSFLAATVVGWVMRRTGRRFIPRAIVNLVGLVLSIIAMYAAASRPVLEGTSLPYHLVSSIIGAVFWSRGAWTGSRRPDHEFCLARFEEGIGVFLFIFLLASPARIDFPIAVKLSLSFFLCGIASLGISRGPRTVTSGFSRFSRGAALVPAAVAFMVASLGLFLIVPALQEAAGRTRLALKEGSIEFIRLLGILLTKLFKFRPASAQYSGNGGGPFPVEKGESAAPGLFASILMTVILVVVLALIIGIMIHLLVQFLRAKASLPRKRGEPIDLSFLPAWLRAVVRGLARFRSRVRNALAKRRRKRSAAVSAYIRLLDCGHGTGCSRKPVETPREYARRMTIAFPRAARQAEFIAGALENEVYGVKATDGSTAVKLIEAKKRLVLRSFLAERIGRAFRRTETRRTVSATDKRGDTLA